jgi:hypothetical protein
MIKKSKRINQNSNEANKSFIFVFTLIQNATEIKQFDEYLLLAYDVFTSKYNNNHVQTCIERLKHEIRQRKLIVNTKNPLKNLAKMI